MKHTIDQFEDARLNEAFHKHVLGHDDGDAIDYCKNLERALAPFHYEESPDFRGGGVLGMSWRFVLYQLPSLSSAGFGWYCVLDKTVQHPYNSPPDYRPTAIIGRNDGHPARAVVIACLYAVEWEPEESWQV